jgi:chromosome segregation ATPase
MIGTRALFVIVAITTAVAGCAGVSSDPRTGGLASGIHGIATGAYDQRITDRRNTLTNLKGAEDALSKRLDTSVRQLGIIDRRLAQQKAALAALNSDLSALDDRLKKVKEAQQAGTVRLASFVKVIEQATLELQRLKRAAAEHEERNKVLDELRKQAEREAKARADEKSAIPPDRRATIEEIERRATEQDRRQRELDQRKNELSRTLASLSV